MKIVWLNGNPNQNFGGTEIHSVEMVKELKKRGLDLLLVVAKGSYVDRYTQGVKKHYISFPNSLAFYSTYKLAKLLKREKPQILIANNGKEYLNALICGKLSKAKVVFFRHMERMKSWGVKRFVFPYVDLFLAVSDHVKRNLIEEGVKPERVKVVYNLIDEERFYWKEKPRDFLNFLFVGKVDKGKGVWDLLYAFERLSKIKDKVRCFYVGEGPEREKLQKAVYEKGLKDKVFVVGYTKEVERYYQHSHVCVIPSKETEAFPRVAIEALACGCALISSDVGGTKEAILEGKNGYVFMAGDVEGLFQKMLKASQEWESLSLDSLRLYRERFSRQKVMESFIRALEELL
ncbi:MAG: glycosyltransferase family 4 protein [Aquificaceae bacterium]